MRFSPLTGPGRRQSQLYFFFLLIKKMKLGHVIIIVGMYPNGLLKFSAPIPFFAKQPAPFCQISMHNWVYCKSQIFVLVIKQVTEIFFYFVFQYQCRRYFTCTIAGWANFLGVNGYFRFHSLPRNLHEAEFRYG